MDTYDFHIILSGLDRLFLLISNGFETDSQYSFSTCDGRKCIGFFLYIFLDFNHYKKGPKKFVIGGGRGIQDYKQLSLLHGQSSWFIDGQSLDNQAHTDPNVYLFQCLESEKLPGTQRRKHWTKVSAMSRYSPRQRDSATLHYIYKGFLRSNYLFYGKSGLFRAQYISVRLSISAACVFLSVDM